MTDPETLRARVAEIARGLTKAQADVLFVPSNWLFRHSHLSLEEIDQMIGHGLIEPVFSEVKPGYTFACKFWRASPLGIAVRAHLQGTTDD